MHAKVTIASLVFGLVVGFAANIGTSQKITKTKEENMVCNHDNHEHIEFSPKPKEAGLKDIIKDIEPKATHVHSYTYEYLNDGRHKGTCSCGNTIIQEHVFNAYYPYGHGHNDMIRCSVCNTNVEVTPLDINYSVSGYVASGEAKWYFFEAGSGVYTFESSGNSDPYGELYAGEYPTARTTYNDDGGVNRNFKITYTFSSTTRVFLRVRGYNWNAASYSVSVYPHTHNYNQLSDYNETYHKRTCSCGAYYLQPHAFGDYQNVNEHYHRATCACGRYRLEEHVYDTLYPYGHGHNEILHCSACSNNVECERIVADVYYDGFVETNECNWYVFYPQETGTYVFETIGDSDTFGTVYINDVPADATPFSNDDDGPGYNFKIVKQLVSGDMVFIQVREYDWENANYELKVYKQAQPVQPVREWTIMYYHCTTCIATHPYGSSVIDDIPVPSDVNIIYQAGDGGHVVRSHDEGLNNVLNEVLPEGTCMGDEQTFEDFLRWGLEYYPANKVGVVIRNHGQALEGICIDNAFEGNTLLNSEIRTALRNVLGENPTQKLEFIGYDACLMQVQDIAEFDSRYFKYMVGSEEEEVDRLWSSDWLINVYNKADTLTILNSIVDNYISMNGSERWGQTLSVLDLSKMSTYYTRFENLASQIAVVNDFESLERAINDSWQFGTGLYDGGGTSRSAHGVIDGRDFLVKLRNEPAFYNLTSSINSVINAYDDVVVANDTTGGMSGYNPATGMSIHVWIEGLGQRYEQSETNFQNWRSLFINAQ